MDSASCHVRCAGADGGRAEALATEMVHLGCSALLSFGLAGGLAPALRAGDVVLAEGVVADGQTLPADRLWGHRLANALAGKMPVTMGMLAGVQTAVSTSEEKQRIHAETGALALDMESHSVAAVARDAQLPFLAIRVIADVVNQSIPPWLIGVIDDAGKVRPSVFLSGLMRRPADVIEIFRLAGVNRRAMASLRRVALILGPSGFGLL